LPAGRDEHLGHEEVAGLKVLADFVHPGDETTRQDLCRAHALTQRLLDQFSYLFPLTSVQT
jgi:hypothetical protein